MQDPQLGTEPSAGRHLRVKAPPQEGVASDNDADISTSPLGWAGAPSGDSAASSANGPLSRLNSSSTASGISKPRSAREQVAAPGAQRRQHRTGSVRLPSSLGKEGDFVPGQTAERTYDALSP